MTQKPPKPLYFIAIVPPEPERTRLWELKKEFSERYATTAALRSPPHLTLHMPFRFREDREHELISVLARLASGEQAIDICLEGYGAFPPRVLYADVLPSEALGELQKKIGLLMRERFNIFNADYKDRPFRPHLTLAFRDLKKDMFLKAWEENKDQPLEICWNSRSFCLLRHNGKTWDIREEMNLKPA